MSNRGEIESIARDMTSYIPGAIKTSYDVRLLYVRTNIEIIAELRRLSDIAVDILETLQEKETHDAR